MVGRRELLLAATAVLLAGAGSTEEPSAEIPEEAPDARRWQVGMVVLDVPEGVAPDEPPPGWDWAASGPEGMTLLVKGSTAFPSPHLAMARVLGPDEHGRVPWQVVGNPPQPVNGTDDYVVVDVRSAGAEPRSGALVCATLDGRTAVVLVSGPRGWSPALRRAVLSGIEVTGAR